MYTHKLTTLKNGVRLITIPMPQVESVTVMILIGVGSRFENKKISGLSHFLEHMTFKGTQKRPTALDISFTLDAIGGEYNAFTDKEVTGFYVKALSSHLDLAFDVLTDMVLNSRFEEKEIEREKGVIIEEINMYLDNPQTYVWSVFEKLLYGDHPLGWDIAGEKNIIKNLKRTDFLDYLKTFYKSKNLVVVVAGDIKRKVEDLTEKYLGHLPTGKKKPYLPIREAQEKPQVKIYFKKTDQTHLCLGVRGYHLTHPDRYPLGVLATILGQGASSRLFIKVRERRGLAYYISGISQRYKDCGFFVAHAGVDLRKTEEAIAVILAEFEKVKKELVKEKELAKAKEFWKGRLVLGLEDSKGVAGLYGSQELLEEKIETEEEMREKIDKVTAEDIKRVAQDIFVNEKLNLAIIGPFGDRQKFEKILKLG